MIISITKSDMNSLSGRMCWVILTRNLQHLLLKLLTSRRTFGLRCSAWKVYFQLYFVNLNPTNILHTGRIDATVKVVRHDLKSSLGQHKHNRAAELVPLEIKSGASSATSAVSHRAQLSLYTFLLSDRHSQHVDIGNVLLRICADLFTTLGVFNRSAILFEGWCGLWCASWQRWENVTPYAEEHSCFVSRRVATNPWWCWASANAGGQWKSMSLLLRQELLYALPQGIPPLHIQSFVDVNSIIDFKAYEGGSALSSDLSHLYEKLTDHLDDNECHYFMLWDRLLELEAREPSASRAEVFQLLLNHIYPHALILPQIWTLGSKERELQGKCASGLLMTRFHEPRPSVCVYTFRRNDRIGILRSHQHILFDSVSLISSCRWRWSAS